MGIFHQVQIQYVNYCNCLWLFFFILSTEHIWRMIVFQGHMGAKVKALLLKLQRDNFCNLIHSTKTHQRKGRCSGNRNVVRVIGRLDVCFCDHILKPQQ